MKKYFLAGIVLVVLLTSAVTTSTIIFEDHFVENENGWSLGTDDWCTSKITNGKLYYEGTAYIKNEGGSTWLTVPDLKLPMTGFTVKCNTKWVKHTEKDDTYYGYGFAIGEYYFLLYGYGDRRLLFYNTTEEKYETIVDWGETTFVKKYTEANDIKIVYKDGKAAFYCNGEMLYKKEIKITEADKLKIYVEESEAVEFDDLIVTKD